jgi:hypothetical protein
MPWSASRRSRLAAGHNVFVLSGRATSFVIAEGTRSRLVELATPAAQ